MGSQKKNLSRIPNKTSLKIFANDRNKICGFELKNHTESYVCAAVSILALNAVNSIEAFAGLDFSCESDKEKAYIKLYLPETNEKSDLLLDSFLLGMTGIHESYKNCLDISEEYYAEN
jgi:uncharacterized protein YsxB (DUF464 family)